MDITLSPAGTAARSAVPHMLAFQKERDEAGGGVALRVSAERALRQTIGTPGLRRQEAKALVLRSFDRLLSDDARCSAYEAAIQAALRRGARTACLLGSGSLLPALLLARAGVAVCVVEPLTPLADIVRACARDNGLRVAVLPTVAAAAHAWGGAPDVLLSEDVDDGLLGERIVPKLREARRALHGAAAASPSQPTLVLPCRAVVSGALVQLGFEGVDGFGLEQLDLDLRYFDALRPSGARASVSPGFWPVRLADWRQPHARLSLPFGLADIDLDAATAPGAAPGAGGVGGAPSSQEVAATGTGLLNAVVYWFQLDVCDEGTDASVSSAPPERGGRAGSWCAGWRQAAVYLERPLYVRAGERVAVTVSVLEERIHISVARLSQPTAKDLPSPVAPPPPPQALLPTAMVPCNAYHFCMLADTARNAAYRRAIERAVRRRPGCRVLDVGAGSGLLGVIAARAGAAHVDAVEMNGVLAATARRTLGGSGVPSFRVWNCVSTQLSVDREATGEAAEGAERRLARRADVVVSETLDTSLIGEGAIHSLRHAAVELATPGAQLIPAGATLYLMAAELLPPDSGGFAFGALDALREGYTPLRLHTVAHTCLSAPAEALRIDFGAPAGQGAAAGAEAAVVLGVTRRGKCNAIVWWFDLHLDEMETLSVAPGSAVRTWKQNVHYLPSPIAVEKGDVIDAAILNHNDDNLHVTRADKRGA